MAIRVFPVAVGPSIVDEIYTIELELKDNVSKKFKNQFEYLKKYIKKYNKRHNTNYTISIYSDEC